jgi:hypothetical protein
MCIGIRGTDLIHIGLNTLSCEDGHECFGLHTGRNFMSNSGTVDAEIELGSMEALSTSDSS